MLFRAAVSFACVIICNTYMFAFLRIRSKDAKQLLFNTGVSREGQARGVLVVRGGASCSEAEGV
eukprot:1117770-Pyramimonas_sp.AAC.1